MGGEELILVSVILKENKLLVNQMESVQHSPETRNHNYLSGFIKYFIKNQQEAFNTTRKHSTPPSRLIFQATVCSFVGVVSFFLFFYCSCSCYSLSL